MRIAIIIPAYNEEQTIKKVVESVHNVAEKYQLSLIPVVVNDCSIDKTGEIINKLNCVALHLPINLGIGGAVQAGMKYALQNNFEYAVQMDGDGQHPAEELIKLIEKCNQENADVVIGSRFISGEGFQSTFLRRVGIGFFSNLIHFLSGYKIADTTSGYRLFNKKALALINEYYPDEYPEPEAIIYFSKNNLKVVETPVTMKERQGGVSSIGVYASVYYMLKVSLALIFTYIRLYKNK
ncbi:MAG: glycosyltransferase family 2 protein [Bacteroidia bacterium]